MKSGSSSCLSTVIVVLVALFLLRFALPELWVVLVRLFAGAAVIGVVAFLALLAILGYFTYKNLRSNKVKEQEEPFGHVERTQALYRSVVNRLQTALEFNQVSAEELLQSEILVGERLPEVKKELIRLRELVSPASQRIVNDQLGDYQQKMRQATDPAAKEVFAENVRMLEEKKERMKAAADEIRQKEATIDLVYNGLVRAEDDLKFGRPVSRLLPADVYARFGIEAPSGQRPPLPPLTDKSSNEG